MSDDLVTFLRRCLDDDERVALAIQGDRYGDNGDGGWKTWTIEQREGRNWPYLGALGVELAHSYGDNVITPQRGEHIARWDPARVLAEVEAKRAILDAHHPNDPCDSHGPAYETIPCDTILSLAQPYADRPGWREEWRA